MKAAVVTLSDKGFRNEREDKSGELVQMMLKEADMKWRNTGYFRMSRRRSRRY